MICSLIDKSTAVSNRRIYGCISSIYPYGEQTMDTGENAAIALMCAVDIEKF